APPPGQSKPYVSPLFKLKPWIPPPPPPSPPKKPLVPRLSGQPEPRPVTYHPPSTGSEVPYSQKYKIGEAGKPGPGFTLHQIKPLPPITELQAAEPPKSQRVPIQLPTVAKIDSRGNLTIGIEGNSKNIPPGVTVQPTLIKYVNASPASRVKFFIRDLPNQLRGVRMYPWKPPSHFNPAARCSRK
ncbi:hypothetical protein BgiMline_015946, partial [Biomphalaria glabrata]